MNMNWCFRYRVKISKPPEVEKDGGSIVQLPELPPVSITVHDAYPTGKWVTFKVCGFPTEDSANVAGKQFGDTLLAHPIHSGVAYRAG